MIKEIKGYDESNNEIYYKSSSGFEIWKKYDENHRIIYYKNSKGYEWWGKYDNYYRYNKFIEITQQEFKQIERTKEKQELYLNIKNSNRFEIMDI